MINSDTPAPTSPRAGVIAAHTALIAAEAAHDRAFGVRFPDGRSARIVAKQAEDQARSAYIAAAEAYFAEMPGPA